jgi:predicted Zn-dependent peptidase
MRRRTFPGTALAALALALAPAAAQKVEPRVHVLDNGMTFLFLEQHEAPTIASGWLAKVGSVNERPGMTGISHLFEHMMFKGTTTIGTQDAERDAQIIAELDGLRAQIREEKQALVQAWRRGEVEDPEAVEAKTPKHRELEQRFQALIEEQRSLIVKDEFDKIYTRHGGSSMNAGTTEDFTIYFIVVPANKLELWFWMESDRLYDPVFREFYSERDVVYEERRLRIESTPTGKFQEAFNAMFWEASPYSWPVVGWPSDLPAITREQANEYFNTYYSPNNLVVALVGDFDTDEAIALAEKYFGRIPRGRKEPPPVVTREPEQLAEKRFYAEAETKPNVELWYHGVPFGHRDMYALDLLERILNGRTGRLHKALVEEKGVVNRGEAYASQDNKKYAGVFAIEGNAKTGHEPEEVEAAIDEVVARLQEGPVSDYELQKVKNQAQAETFRRLQSKFFLMFQLLMYEASGAGWDHINRLNDRLQAVTAEDIQKVAKTYLLPTNRSVAIYRTKESEGNGGPDPLAGLPEERRQMIRQMLAMLPQMKDAGQLEGILGQIEGRLAEAETEDERQAMEYLASKLRERLEALAEPAGAGTAAEDPS